MPALRPATLAATLSLALAALVLPPCMAAPRPAELASTTPAETASATPRGSTFLLTEGWTRRVQDNAVILTPPEAGGSRVAIVDALAADPDAAVAEAWAVLGLSPKLLVATDPAPRDGWEQRRFYEYDVAAPQAGLSDPMIRQAQRNALTTAFLSSSEKEALLQKKKTPKIEDRKSVV